MGAIGRVKNFTIQDSIKMPISNSAVVKRKDISLYNLDSYSQGNLCKNRNNTIFAHHLNRRHTDFQSDAQAVTTEQQIIVAEDVTQEENDKQQLHPMLEQAEENRQAVEIEEEIGVALADPGYCSEDNFTKNPAGKIELLVATQKDYKQRKAMAEQPPPDEPIPDDLSPTEVMERKLLTERGRTLYKIRGQTVEPVFGQIKDVRGFDRFMQRGIEACRGEWSLICATHNLLKLW